jgi:tight adherence protein B
MMVPFLISLLLFLSITAGGYFVWNKIAPLYDRYRADTILHTLSSLDDQFLFWTPRQADLLHLFSTAGGSIFGGFFFSGIDWRWFIVALFLSGFLGYQIPHRIISLLSRKRVEEIERQIPDFLKMMSGALRAGLSLPEAVNQAVKELPAPLSQELGLVLKKLRMGESFEESFKFLERRVKIEEMSLVVSAIILSNEAGGSLTPLFDRLENTLFERKRIKAKIAALTAQGKIQGWVVGALPLFLGFILFLIDPGLMTPFWTTLPGGIGLVLILFLETAGFLLINRIVEGGEV